MNPITADLMTKLVKEGSRTSLSRLALNSEAIPDVSLRNHLRALTGVMDKGWKQPTKAEVESTIKKTNNAVNKSMSELADGTKTNQKEIEVREMDDLVSDTLGKREAYRGIKEGEITQKDKDLIIELHERLSKYNNKMGNNLSEVLGGIYARALGGTTEVGKTLNAFNRQDFILVNEFVPLSSSTV